MGTDKTKKKQQYQTIGCWLFEVVHDELVEMFTMVEKRDDGRLRRETKTEDKRGMVCYNDTGGFEL
jgi:hypothetical protein